MAIDPSKLMEIGVFKARVDEWINTIKSSKLQSGVAEILLPGERAQREQEKRLKNGVPVNEALWQHVVTMATEVGLDLDALR